VDTKAGAVVAMRPDVIHLIAEPERTFCRDAIGPKLKFAARGSSEFAASEAARVRRCE
jgi:hypothetical protein